MNEWRVISIAASMLLEGQEMDNLGSSAIKRICLALALAIEYVAVTDLQSIMLSSMRR